MGTIFTLPSGLFPCDQIELTVSNATPTPGAAQYTHCKSLIVQAPKTNNGDIFIGGAGAGNQKISVGPGQTYILPIRDLSEFYALAETDGEKLILWSWK